jgi:hypothetical protein
MKLKGKPKAPERKDVNHQIELPYDVVVFDILPHCIKHLTTCDDYVEGELTLLSEHDLRLDYGRGYYDSVDMFVNFTTLESLNSFSKRVASYDKRMDDYNIWLHENADEIAAEIAERERKQVIAFRVKTQAKVDKLSDQLLREHNKLAALKQ